MRDRMHNTVRWRWLAAGVSLALLGACSPPRSDEARLRQAVSEMEKAAEARQAGPILGYLDDRFEGNQVYRKANIRAMLLLQYRLNPHVHVFLHITRIQIKGQSAHLVCEVLLAGRDKRLVPERVRVLVVDSAWAKHDGDWRVIRAKWRDPLLQP